jgi:ferrous iron transport protein B
MVPFMSCSARLAIFSVFVAAFFPAHGALIVLSLYLIGIVFAVLTGWVVKRAFAFEQDSILILELPNYQWPKTRLLVQEATLRLKHFLKRAIRVIVPVCMVLGSLNALTITGEFKPGSETSLLAIMGQWVTPMFAPMGISESNWPATVGLLSGVLAKEVVIGTLNTLYTPELTETAAHSFHLWTALKAAFFSIGDNAKELGGALFSPFTAAAPTESLNQAAFGQMASQFSSGASAYAYLLFTLLYVPCVSTLAVIKKELNRFWMMFSLVWSTAMAYFIAMAFYQLSQLSISLWLVLLLSFGLIALFACVLLSLRYFLTLRMKVLR